MRHQADQKSLCNWLHHNWLHWSHMSITISITIMWDLTITITLINRNRSRNRPHPCLQQFVVIDMLKSEVMFRPWTLWFNKWKRWINVTILLLPSLRWHGFKELQTRTFGGLADKYSGYSPTQLSHVFKSEKTTRDDKILHELCM